MSSVKLPNLLRKSRGGLDVRDYQFIFESTVDSEFTSESKGFVEKHNNIAKAQVIL